MTWSRPGVWLEFGLLLGGAFGVEAGVELGLFCAPELKGDTLLSSAAAETLHNMPQCEISEGCAASAAQLAKSVACAKAGCCSGTLPFGCRNEASQPRLSHTTLPRRVASLQFQPCCFELTLFLYMSLLTLIVPHALLLRENPTLGRAMKVSCWRKASCSWATPGSWSRVEVSGWDCPLCCCLGTCMHHQHASEGDCYREGDLLLGDFKLLE